jgi:hypothetical protein
MLSYLAQGTTMIETTITLFAIACAASVAVMCLIRWRRATGFKSSVYFCFAVFAAFVMILNLSALVATGGSFVRTATLAYIGFATAILLPAARALGRLTYDAPDNKVEKRDAPT